MTANKGRSGVPAAAFWRNLFDSHPDLLMYLDLDHRVVYVNEAQARALGRAAEELVGHSCFEVMHGNGSLAEGCPCQFMARENREQTAEIMFERLLGGYFLVTVKPVFDAAGRQIGVLHVSRDITASKILESELRGTCDSFGARVESRAMELRNRLLFDRLLAMMARRLDPAVSRLGLKEMIQAEVGRIVEALGFGRCVFWEGRGAALHVVARSESAAARLPPLADTATRESAPFLFSGAGRGGFVRTLGEGVARCAAGTFAPASESPSFLLLVECREDTPGCDFLFEDALRLTCEMLGGLVRRAAEVSDMQLLRQKLVQADHVARTGQLAAALAHELNQPLAAALCNAQAAARLLAQTPPDVSETRVALDDIVAAAKRAGTVMQHTRALYKGVFANRKPLDLNATVTSVLGLVRGDVALTGVVVETALAPDLPRVLANETQLQQVVRNLLANACDAVCGKLLRERAITISTGVTADGGVELCVQDSGVGIPEGMEEKIFAPFCTTKSEGQGMGLSICLQIMQSHGGTIRAERAEGGTLFRLTLPSCPEQYHHQARENPPEMTSDGSAIHTSQL
jgi:PAS domain S-box-containing protein